MNVKAIPFYLSGRDVQDLLVEFKKIVDHPSFDRTNTIVIMGQQPMSCQLYLVVRYDDSGDESIINLC